MPNFLTRLLASKASEAAASQDGESSLIAFSAPVDIQAAEGSGAGKRPSFSIKAYTGTVMSVGGYYYPVVVELTGLTSRSQQLPILLNHDPEQLVGQSSKVTIGKDVVVSGTITGDDAPAQKVTSHAKNGFQWQASIGASVTRREFVEAGQSVTVNGQSFTGPLIVAREAMLSEVSFVPSGADGNTSATVAANASKEAPTMTFEQWLQAKNFDAAQLTDEQRATLKAAYDAEIKAAAKPPVASQPTATVTATATPANDPPTQPTQAAGQPLQATGGLAEMRAELARASAIERLCASAEGVEPKAMADIKAKALAEGWTADATELALLRAGRGSTAPAAHIAPGRTFDGNVITAAIMQAGGLHGDAIEKQFDDKTLQAAHTQFRGRIGLQELFLCAAWANGYHGHSMRHDVEGVLRAAFSTLAISGILSNTANKFLLMGFESIETAWRMISSRRPVNDFKTTTSYRLTGSGFAKVGPGGELKHGTLGELPYTNKADSHGEIMGITFQDIRNDDLGALTSVPRKIGRDGALHLNDVFWTEFLDNAAFFAAANNNYFDGASSNLQSSSLTTAVTTFRKQTDPNGKPLGITPALLLVPVEEEVTADELYVSTNNNSGGAATKEKIPNRNVHAGKYQPVPSAYLSNTAYSGASTTAWYLLADPEDLSTIEVVFLDGVETPTVETANADFSVLGVQMRGVFHFGVNKQEYRGGVKSKGAA